MSRISLEGRSGHWIICALLAISCGFPGGTRIAYASDDSGQGEERDGHEDRDVTTARTAQGTVRGVQHAGVVEFLGIPYAKPPVGALRWKPPARPDKYATTYDASFARSECVQGSPAKTVGNEDCLYLNIYRPTPETGAATNAPVVVWIHGGGYSSGSGFQFNLAPLAIAQSVVTVSINYRLGAFGFLAHPALSAEEDPPRSGNYGILDMQEALEWVRRNIRAFGGNSKNVTIIGESAGGNAMYVLLASPTSAGLFDRVIAQSGGYYRAQPSLATAEARGLSAAANQYGCPDQNSDPAAQAAVASCLRSLSASAVLAATVTEPIVDNKVLVETTADAFKNGRFNKVPLMAGSTHDEGTVFTAFFADLAGNPVTPANYAAFASHLYSNAAAQVVSHYPLASYSTPSQALAAAVGDYHMFCGAMQDVDNVTDHVPIAYFYDWDDPTPASPASFVAGYPPPDPLIAMGAAHSLDITYWFGLILPADVTPARVVLSTTMMTYLGNFARTSDPNGRGLPIWYEYSTPSREVIFLGYPIRSDYNAFSAHQCAFWYTAPPSESLF